MSNDNDADPQLFARLQQSKKQTMYFAALYKGKEGTIVVAKSKVSASVLNNAKKKLAGAVVLGTVTAEGNEYRFACPGGSTVASSLKAIIASKTGMKLNCVVVAPNQAERDEEDDEGKEEKKSEEAKKDEKKSPNKKEEKKGKEEESNESDEDDGKKKDDKPKIDAALKAAISAAKNKKMHFALVGTSADAGKLIIGTRTPAPKVIAEAKKEHGASAVFRGVVQGEKGTMVFLFPKKPPQKFAALIKALGVRDAKVSMKVRLGIMTDKNDLGDIGPSDDPPTDELDFAAWDAAAAPLRDEFREVKAAGHKGLDAAAKLYKQAKQLATDGKIESAFAVLGEFEEELDKIAEELDGKSETPEVEDKVEEVEELETVEGEDESVDVGFGTSEDEKEETEEGTEDEGKEEKKEEEPVDEVDEEVEEDGKKRKKSTYEKILDLIALIASMFSRSSSDSTSKTGAKKKGVQAKRKGTRPGKKEEEESSEEDDEKKKGGGDDDPDVQDQNESDEQEEEEEEEVEEKPSYPSLITKDQAKHLLESLKEIYHRFKHSSRARVKARLKLVRKSLLDAKRAIKSLRGKEVEAAMKALNDAVNEAEDSYKADQLEWQEQAGRIKQVNADIDVLDEQAHKDVTDFRLRAYAMGQSAQYGKYKEAHHRLASLEKRVHKALGKVSS